MWQREDQSGKKRGKEREPLVRCKRTHPKELSSVSSTLSSKQRGGIVRIAYVNKVHWRGRLGRLGNGCSDAHAGPGGNRPNQHFASRQHRPPRSDVVRFLCRACLPNARRYGGPPTPKLVNSIPNCILTVSSYRASHEFLCSHDMRMCCSHSAASCCQSPFAAFTKTSRAATGRSYGTVSR